MNCLTMYEVSRIAMSLQYRYRNTTVIVSYSVIPTPNDNSSMTSTQHEVAANGSEALFVAAFVYQGLLLAVG